MIKIIAPGSTSNLGPGFDCLGMALNIYNRFTVEEASETALFGVEDSHNNRDNLFLKAYRKGCAYGGRQPHIHVHFDCDVPISRGLGSSSTLIAAGLTAAAYMQDEIFGKDTIFQLAAEMEGHPDNAAPCVFGGMTASSMLEDGSFITRRLNVHPDWLFTVLVQGTGDPAGQLQPPGGCAQQFQCHPDGAGTGKRRSGSAEQLLP